ncbi:ParA family protein [Sulfurimonas paralvinellae]|uniref:ParA family protein n=1 Tax=Sulfurimonas paralvinellae TaxID=317658 RepID=A0A7M1BDC3_9BACT|nr:ParA family protein [Sulfurimonas paralvinellae]QOP46818.1 ParA family protein [Sulfurimonas paralvinellae]
MIIAISHQKGGVGKSTIAYNLAVELSKKYNVNVVDLDVQQTITACNVIRSKFGQKKLNILSFDDKKDFVEFLNNDDERNITVIDTGGFDSGLNRVAMYAADLIITPVSTEFLEVIGLEKYKAIIKEVSKKVGKNIKTHVILNKIHHSQQNFNDIQNFIQKSSKQFDLLNSVLRRRSDFSISLSHGFSVCEFDNNSDSSKEIKALIAEISNILDFKKNAKKIKRKKEK